MSDILSGNVLPVPDQVYTGPMVFDAKQVEERLLPIAVARPPAQAP